MKHPKRTLDEVLDQIHSVFGFTCLSKITPNSVGEFGRLPLSIVISWNDLEAMEILISAGADISARGEFGSTPLFHAIEMQHYQAAARLIELGADIHTKNDLGLSVIDFAKQIGDSEALNVMGHGEPK